MSDSQAAEIASPSAELTPTPAKKRGRPAGTKSTAKPESKPENPQQRLAQLKADVEKAQQALREFEAGRNAIVGRVVVAESLEDAEFAKLIADRLRKRVTAKGELALIAELLV